MWSLKVISETFKNLISKTKIFYFLNCQSDLEATTGQSKKKTFYGRNCCCIVISSSICHCLFLKTNLTNLFTLKIVLVVPFASCTLLFWLCWLTFASRNLLCAKKALKSCWWNWPLVQYLQARLEPTRVEQHMGRHDTQHNNNYRNDTQHNDLFTT